MNMRFEGQQAFLVSIYLHLRSVASQEFGMLFADIQEEGKLCFEIAGAANPLSKCLLHHAVHQLGTALLRYFKIAWHDSFQSE